MRIEVEFKSMGHWNYKLVENFWQMKEDEHEEAYKAVEILNANYSIPYLNNIALTQHHLDNTKKHQLGKLLTTYKEISKARPSQWKGHPINVELKNKYKATESATISHYSCVQKGIT